MAKIEQKVKANPYHFGRFLPLFQLFKNGSKQRLNALESFSTTPIVVLGRFKPFLKIRKNGENRAESKG